MCCLTLLSLFFQSPSFNFTVFVFSATFFWLYFLCFFSHVLLTLVCSSNFYIYYIKHGSICKREQTSRTDPVEMQERTSTRRVKNPAQKSRSLFSLNDSKEAWGGEGPGLVSTPLKKSLGLTPSHPSKLFVAQNVILLEFFGQPSRFLLTFCKKKFQVWQF